MFCYNLNCVTDTIYIFIFAVQAHIQQCACHQRSGISLSTKNSPCIAKGFHSGLGMIPAMDMEEEMTLGPFAPWSFCRGFWKTLHIMCINETADRAVSEQLDRKDAMQQESRLLSYTQMTEQLADTTSKLEKD